MIDKQTAQRIKDTADIVEVVSDYVQLRRSGSNFMGLCPFHNERTPSFSVNRAKNFCYCFSCHKGGSPVNFIIEKEGVSYPEALRILAKKYGIPIEEKEASPEERERQNAREARLLANEWAMKHFEDNLHTSADGRDIGLAYIYGREVTYEAVKAFHLGYAIDNSRHFSDAARQAGFDLGIMADIGLVGKRDNGSYYDRFRGRVMFPIQNVSGKTVGFGGRDLQGGNAKYINSPESLIYKKSYELYGIWQAKSAMRQKDECFLVEGYFDVIGMWQSGMKNVVASSGTALTDGQIELIKRFTSNVTLIYDGDEAGIKAALRGVDLLLNHDMNVNVLVLPDKDDPDSFARKHTPQEFQDYVDSNKTDVIRFKTMICLKGAGNNPRGRYEAINQVVESIAHISDRMKRLVYVQDSSRLLGVPEEELARSVAARRRQVEHTESQRLTREAAVAANPQPQAPASPADAQPTSEKKRFELGRSGNPLEPLEWKVLQYCIRFGFLFFCQVNEDENDPESPYRVLDVVDYVREELEYDEISFSTEEFNSLFTLIKDMHAEFAEALEAFCKELDEKEKERLRAGYDEIGTMNLSTDRIAIEEMKLQESIRKWKQNETDLFSRDFVARRLASHEDDTVRYLTTEALREKHQLSHIYSRERPAEKEEDKLLMLVPTALTVLKSGIVDAQINALFNRFRQITAAGGSVEQQQEIQIELTKLMKYRSELAKNIGDRILSPYGAGTSRGSQGSH